MSVLMMKSKNMVHECLKSGGVLQKPMNMRVDSKRPKGVMNAAFHWLESWICCYNAIECQTWCRKWSLSCH